MLVSLSRRRANCCWGSPAILWLALFLHKTGITRTKADPPQMSRDARISLCPSHAVFGGQHDTIPSDDHELAVSVRHVQQTLISPRVAGCPSNTTSRGNDRPGVTHGDKDAIAVGDASKSLFCPGIADSPLAAIGRSDDCAFISNCDEHAIAISDAVEVGGAASRSVHPTSVGAEGSDEWAQTNLNGASGPA